MNETHTHESFTFLAIEKLPAAPPPKNGAQPKGRVIHTVFSGFNAAFRKYFDGACPVTATKELCAEGKISMMLVRRGAYIAHKGVLPKREEHSADDSLKKMGL